MRGIERTRTGEVRHYYQYKSGGPKYYYQKCVGRVAAPRPPPQKPRQPPPPPRTVPSLSPIERAYRSLPEGVRTLISTWLLVMDFRSIRDISRDAIAKAFRRLSLIHHPDRGGSEDNYKQLATVRDHLITLCEMAAAM